MIRFTMISGLVIAASAFVFAGPSYGALDLSPITSAHAANAPSKLGDLSKFRVIAVDTSKLVDANDLAGAKKRIKDLETSWDDAEPSLKPRAAADWHKLDKAIDDALEALREPSPSQSKCRNALDNLLVLMNRMG